MNIRDDAQIRQTPSLSLSGAVRRVNFSGTRAATAINISNNASRWQAWDAASYHERQGGGYFSSPSAFSGNRTLRREEGVEGRQSGYYHDTYYGAEEPELHSSAEADHTTPQCAPPLVSSCSLTDVSRGTLGTAQFDTDTLARSQGRGRGACFPRTHYNGLPTRLNGTAACAAAHTTLHMANIPSQYALRRYRAEVMEITGGVDPALIRATKYNRVPIRDVSGRLEGKAGPGGVSAWTGGDSFSSSSASTLGVRLRVSGGDECPRDPALTDARSGTTKKVNEVSSEYWRRWSEPARPEAYTIIEGTQVARARARSAAAALRNDMPSHALTEEAAAVHPEKLEYASVIQTKPCGGGGGHFYDHPYDTSFNLQRGMGGGNAAIPFSSIQKGVSSCVHGTTLEEEEEERSAFIKAVGHCRSREKDNRGRHLYWAEDAPAGVNRVLLGCGEASTWQYASRRRTDGNDGSGVPRMISANSELAIRQRQQAFASARGLVCASLSERESSNGALAELNIILRERANLGKDVSLPPSRVVPSQWRRVPRAQNDREGHTSLEGEKQHCGVAQRSRQETAESYSADTRSLSGLSSTHFAFPDEELVVGRRRRGEGGSMPTASTEGLVHSCFAQDDDDTRPCTTSAIASSSCVATAKASGEVNDELECKDAEARRLLLLTPLMSPLLLEVNQCLHARQLGSLEFIWRADRRQQDHVLRLAGFHSNTEREVILWELERMIRVSSTTCVVGM